METTFEDYLRLHRGDVIKLESNGKDYVVLAVKELDYNTVFVLLNQAELTVKRGLHVPNFKLNGYYRLTNPEKL